MSYKSDQEKKESIEEELKSFLEMLEINKSKPGTYYTVKKLQCNLQ